MVARRSVFVGTLHFHNKQNCDLLIYMSVRHILLGDPWLIKAALVSRPSAVTLKLWLSKTAENPNSIFLAS